MRLGMRMVLVVSFFFGLFILVSGATEVKQFTFDRDGDGLFAGKQDISYWLAGYEHGMLSPASVLYLAESLPPTGLVRCKPGAEACVRVPLFTDDSRIAKERSLFVLKAFGARGSYAPGSNVVTANAVREESTRFSLTDLLSDVFAFTGFVGEEGGEETPAESPAEETSDSSSDEGASDTGSTDDGSSGGAEDTSGFDTGDGYTDSFSEDTSGFDTGDGYTDSFGEDSVGEEGTFEGELTDQIGDETIVGEDIPELEGELLVDGETVQYYCVGDCEGIGEDSGEVMPDGYTTEGELPEGQRKAGDCDGDGIVDGTGDTNCDGVVASDELVEEFTLFTDENGAPLDEEILEAYVEQTCPEKYNQPTVTGFTYDAGFTFAPSPGRFFVGDPCSDEPAVYQQTCQEQLMSQSLASGWSEDGLTYFEYYCDDTEQIQMNTVYCEQGFSGAGLCRDAPPGESLDDVFDTLITGEVVGIEGGSVIGEEITSEPGIEQISSEPAYVTVGGDDTSYTLDITTDDGFDGGFIVDLGVGAPDPVIPLEQRKAGDCTGDGVVDAEDEACGGGSGVVPNAGCRSIPSCLVTPPFCLMSTTPDSFIVSCTDPSCNSGPCKAGEVTTEETNTCGNGVRESGEGCDWGSGNMADCNSQGSSCSYCSLSCQMVTTGGKCGDNARCDDDGQIVTTCGDDLCIGGETATSCPADCLSTPAPSMCGDGVREGAEVCDWGASNGIECNGGGKPCSYCGTSCTEILVGSVCGDNACTGLENRFNCAQDCIPKVCGDGLCLSEGGETIANCPLDCTPGGFTCDLGSDVVCGSDGTTYQNACLAQVAGAQVACSGQRCPCDTRGVRCKEDYTFDMSGLYVFSSLSPPGETIKFELYQGSEWRVVAPTIPAGLEVMKTRHWNNEGTEIPRTRFDIYGNLFIGKSNLNTDLFSPYGECVLFPDEVSCGTQEDFVCGADDLTYLNSCVAEESGAVVACAGACPCTTIIAPPESESVCTNDYAPVCGGDGKDYLNSCIAEQAGTTVACESICATCSVQKLNAPICSGLSWDPSCAYQPPTSCGLTQCPDGSWIEQGCAQAGTGLGGAEGGPQRITRSVFATDPTLDYLTSFQTFTSLLPLGQGTPWDLSEKEEYCAPAQKGAGIQYEATVGSDSYYILDKRDGTGTTVAAGGQDHRARALTTPGSLRTRFSTARSFGGTGTLELYEGVYPEGVLRASLSYTPRTRAECHPDYVDAECGNYKCEAGEQTISVCQPAPNLVGTGNPQLIGSDGDSTNTFTRLAGSVVGGFQQLATGTSCTQLSEALVQTMTSYTSSVGTVSSNSEALNYPSVGSPQGHAWGAFSGGTNFWQSQVVSASAPKWIQYSFTTARTLGAYQFKLLGGYPLVAEFTLASSDDGVTWTTRDSASLTDARIVSKRTITNPVSAKYYRITFTKLEAQVPNNPQNTLIGMQSLQFFECIGGSSTPLQPSPSVTSGANPIVAQYAGTSTCVDSTWAPLGARYFTQSGSSIIWNSLPPAFLETLPNTNYPTTGVPLSDYQFGFGAVGNNWQLYSRPSAGSLYFDGQLVRIGQSPVVSGGSKVTVRSILASGKEMTWCLQMPGGTSVAQPSSQNVASCTSLQGTFDAQGKCRAPWDFTASSPQGALLTKDACERLSGGTYREVGSEAQCHFTLGSLAFYSYQPILSAPVTQTCSSFTYSDWSTCANGQQTRTVTSSLPAGCTGGIPITAQSCTVTPPLIVISQQGVCTSAIPRGSQGISSNYEQDVYNSRQAIDGSYQGYGWIVDLLQLNQRNALSSALLQPRLQYDFGTPTTILQYAVAGVQDGNAPNAWVLEGSPSGANVAHNGDWVVLDTQSGMSSWPEATPRTAKVFQIANPGAFRHYRIRFSGNNGGTHIALLEWELFTCSGRVTLGSGATVGSGGGGTLACVTSYTQTSNNAGVPKLEYTLPELSNRIISFMPDTMGENWIIAQSVGGMTPSSGTFAPLSRPSFTTGTTPFCVVLPAIPSTTPQCVSHTYSDWNTCTNGQQSRTIVSSSPPGCAGGIAPVLTQSCTDLPAGTSCTEPVYAGSCPGDCTGRKPARDTWKISKLGMSCKNDLAKVAIFFQIAVPEGRWYVVDSAGKGVLHAGSGGDVTGEVGPLPSYLQPYSSTGTLVLYAGSYPSGILKATYQYTLPSASDCEYAGLETVPPTTIPGVCPSPDGGVVSPPISVGGGCIDPLTGEETDPSFCTPPVGIIGGGDEGTVCTTEYAPVCAEDGTEYPNACLAATANAQIACEGTCPCQEPPAPASCVDSDGDFLPAQFGHLQTNLFGWEARDDVCMRQQGTDYVAVETCAGNVCYVSEGVCSDTTPEAVLDSCDSCRFGVCERKDPLRVGGPGLGGEQEICSADFAPVCGELGETFSNDCEAERAGQEVQCDGECPCDKGDLPPLGFGTGTGGEDGGELFGIGFTTGGTGGGTSGGEGQGETGGSQRGGTTYYCSDSDDQGDTYNPGLAGSVTSTTCVDEQCTTQSSDDVCADEHTLTEYACANDQLVGMPVSCACDAGACTSARGSGVGAPGAASQCIPLFAPVCGTDGATYENACQASVAGITLACDQACPCPVPTPLTPLEEGLCGNKKCDLGETPKLCPGDCPSIAQQACVKAKGVWNPATISCVYQTITIKAPEELAETPALSPALTTEAQKRALLEEAVAQSILPAPGEAPRTTGRALLEKAGIQVVTSSEEREALLAQQDIAAGRPVCSYRHLEGLAKVIGWFKCSFLPGGLR